jgi:hypothetical protein
MAGKTVVMVLDRDDPKRGEITMLAEPREAARLAEDLIESGVEVERIRIFDATEMEMRVVHKPVVSLGTNDSDDPPAYAAEEPPLEHEEFEPVTVGSGASGSDDELDSAQGQSFAEEPLMRNGVRFSSLFKSDDVG